MKKVIAAKTADTATPDDVLKCCETLLDTLGNLNEDDEELVESIVGDTFHGVIQDAVYDLTHNI